MAWAVRGRSSAAFGPSIWRGKPGRRAIALTFDDGPGPATIEILSILAQYKVPATFFQCGQNVLRAPELSQAVCAGPHEIGNHSHTHPNLALRPAGEIVDEFARAQQAIVQATSRTPALMRAPYGVRWFGFREMQQSLGLTGVMWTVIGRDWKLPAAAIAARVLANAADGAIICLHDAREMQRDPDVSQTIEAVHRIVPALLQQGYHFETVSQLYDGKLMANDELTERILGIIAETQRKAPAQVTIDSTFEELGIDSMDGVNIVFALENEFDINVPDEDVKKLRSVRDMVEGVIRLVRDPKAAVLMRRVVVTGIGVICALGRNRERFFEGLCAGRCGIGPITDAGVHSDLRFTQRGRSEGFPRGRSFRAERSRHARPIRAVCGGGAREAVEQSGIEWTDELRETTAIVTGSCVGGQTHEDRGIPRSL